MTISTDSTSTDEAVEETTETVEQPATEDEGQEPDKGQEEKPDGEQADESESEEDEDQDDEPLSREDLRAALTKTRRSEAKTRQRLRDALQQLEAAKSPDEVQGIVENLKAEQAKETRQLMVENVALKFDLPDDLADMLKGETREELEASAKKLAKYVQPEGGDDPDLSGGLDPTKDASGPDLVELSRKARRRR